MDSETCPEPVAEVPCSCACWREVEALKEVVRDQGVKIQNLNDIVVSLLGGEFQVPQNVESSVGPRREGDTVSEPFYTEGVLPVDINSFAPSKQEDIFTTSENTSWNPPANPNLADRSLGKERKSRPQFKCNRDQCDQTFLTRDGLKHHVMGRHDGIRYQCAHCEAFFCKSQTLAKHEKIHATGRQLLKCDLCGAEVVSKMSLRAHLMSRHHIRDRDPKKQPKKGDVKKGRQEAKPLKTEVLTCSQCPRSFDCGASLLYHVKHEHKLTD